jgi:hypothetical protein
MCHKVTWFDLKQMLVSVLFNAVEGDERYFWMMMSGVILQYFEGRLDGKI